MTVRVTSVGFATLAFAIFKPLGMGIWGSMLYLHLAAIWVLGIGVCYLTEVILKYIVRMPASFDKGVEYIIRRNLWFQLVNTPLVALMVCVYFSLFTSRPLPLTLRGYLTMLLVVAFCSFAIGLYWRFKFRSRYLAAELEEVRLLNEKLSGPSPQPGSKGDTVCDLITLSGSKNESLTLSIDDLLYIESIGNYVKVNYLDAGKMPAVQMLRATSKQMEETLKDFPMVVRCHRAFLVNLAQVEKITSQSGAMQLIFRYTHDTIPVSRSNTTQVKSAFNSL